MNDRIKPEHRQRVAYVYVRQSSMHQVRNNVESQKLQYALAERAREFGFRDVVVIDDDLARSSSEPQARPGFARLLAAVCEGTVGAVLAWEVTRLARNDPDWCNLIQFCAVTDTLVMDDDSIYDPKQRDDRLVLGIKSTFSAYEIDVFKQRGRECRKQLIERGETIWRVPVGYARTDENRLEMLPDRQVQEAIRGAFAKLRELGSARQAFLWYWHEKIPLPHAIPGTAGREIEWRLPSYGYILSLIENPTYAGAFAYGRRCSKTVIEDGVAKRRKAQKVPLEEWDVLMLDHHPGYITWDEYLHNRQTLKENSVVPDGTSKGAPKSGPALLVGLLRCGRCGHKLNVAYTGGKSRVPRYHCKRGHATHGVEKCISVGGLRVDEAVVAEVLGALQPLGVQASIDAAEELNRFEDEKRKSLQLALEKAAYEAERARRQFDRVEPENRLVAGELEARWNDALREVHKLERRLQSTRAAQFEITEQERHHLYELGSDLQSLWDHPDTPVQLKKRMLRTVLQEIIIDTTTEPPQTVLQLHWAGGVHTELRAAKNRTGEHSRCTDREIVSLVRELATICDDRQIAVTLNRLGYRTGAGNTWKQHRVRSMRQYHKIPCYDKSCRETWVTLKEAAASLQVSPWTVRQLIERGVLPARQIVRHAPWIIERKDLELPAVNQAAKAVREGKPLPRSVPGQQELPHNERKTP